METGSNSKKPEETRRKKEETGKNSKKQTENGRNKKRQ